MELIRRIEFGSAPKKIQFSHDGSRLLVISREKIISYTLDGTAEGAAIEPLIVFDAAYVNDTQIVVATVLLERTYALVLYDIGTQQVISSVDTDYILGVAVDQHHKRIFYDALTKLLGSEIFIYDLDLNEQGRFRSECCAPTITISHLGNRLAIAGCAFEVWNVSSTPEKLSEECPKEKGDCTGTPCEANRIDITPDGRYAAAGFHGAQGVCAVMENGKVIGWYGPRGDEMDYYSASAVALSPDGKYVAISFGGERTGGETTVPIYRVSDGTIYHRYNVNLCGSARFSPKGDILALGDENSVTLWRFE